MKRKDKYATPKPGSSVIIDGKWSLRHASSTTFTLCPKRSGQSHWNGRATIHKTKGGCFIVSSHMTEIDAHACWGEAVEDAVRRAEAGDKRGFVS